jgi:hypothetical protein
MLSGRYLHVYEKFSFHVMPFRGFLYSEDYKKRMLTVCAQFQGFGTFW